MGKSISCFGGSPTFLRFGIPLRRRRPHEPSSRPPSPGAVEAGGHGGGRSKRNWSTSRRQKDLEARKALGFPVRQSHASGYPTYICKFTLPDLYGLTSYDAVRGSSGKGIASPVIDATNEYIKGQNGRSLVSSPDVSSAWVL